MYSQDAQDAYLEQQREMTLTRKILVIQKMVRSWHYRRRFLKMRKSIVTVQTTLRAYQERKRFIVVSLIVQQHGDSLSCLTNWLFK